MGGDERGYTNNIEGWAGGGKGKRGRVVGRGMQEREEGSEEEIEKMEEDRSGEV